jgi:hypothetical protein
MRGIAGLGLLLLMAGISAAQNIDTNFSTGPQYLITGQSTIFLHSIETPSLSFGPSSAIAPPVTTEPIEAAQVVETPSPLPSGVNLTSIYWGARESGQQSSDQTTGKMSEIELSGAQPAQPLPASLLSADVVNVGVTVIGDVQALHEQGYGVSLADSAAYWKAHKGRASHTFTNKDVEHQSGS